MREKWNRFMMGRYGTDDLSRHLMNVGIILLIINIFLKNKFLPLLILAVLVYVYYRMFSRDYNKRYAENVKYLTV